MAELTTQMLNAEKITSVENLISKLNTINSKQEEKTNFRYEVAGRFGNLASHLRVVDDAIKVAIASTIAITEGQCSVLSYDQLLSALNNNPALAKKGDAICRSDKFNCANAGFVWTNGTNEQKAMVIESRIKAVIKDEDIINHLKSINAIAQVAAVGAASGSPWYWSLIPIPIPIPYTDSKGSFEIGILRYPDLKKPYFQVYKVIMKVFRINLDVGPFGLFNVGKNFVEITFECHRFDVNKAVIDRVSKSSTKEANRYVDSLFT